MMFDPKFTDPHNSPNERLHQKRDSKRGFREPGEWVPKQPGSQEQDAKMAREQGAEESNLGSMEHRVCHKIMVFYTVEIFRLASLGILTQNSTNCALQG